MCGSERESGAATVRCWSIIMLQSQWTLLDKNEGEGRLTGNRERNVAGKKGERRDASCCEGICASVCLLSITITYSCMHNHLSSSILHPGRNNKEQNKDACQIKIGSSSQQLAVRLWLHRGKQAVRRGSRETEGVCTGLEQILRLPQ